MSLRAQPRVTRSGRGRAEPHHDASAASPPSPPATAAATPSEPAPTKKRREVRELEQLAGAIRFVISEPRRDIEEEQAGVKRKRVTRGEGRKEGAGKRQVARNTVCISTFLQDGGLSAIMPSLEVLKKRRTSSTTATPTAALVNGVRKSEKPIPSPLAAHRSPVHRRKSLTQKDKDNEPRNIDNVIFGDITFKAWYPSWYPKEIIGEKEGKDSELVSELYVCNKCFVYSKEVIPWWKHMKQCQGGIDREGLGREVYRFGPGGWEQGENATWSIWEVDGSEQTLFCQNLSLFAKLFLDNKSVFFDVSGFNYFLLVHTSPPTDATSPPARQIIGFFSKEKMSWDNNNLACILIFPPWQRKSLGALLIGVSYLVARREGIMGGPEKPISELGMKGYKRFWGAEVARWVLELEIRPKMRGEEVNVARISRETWIAQEDVLGVLRDMGVVERMEGGVAARVKEREGEGRDGEAVEVVERVKIDKQRVREWVERNKIDLHRVAEEEGFVEGYALPVEGDEEEGGGDGEEGEEGLEEGEEDDE